MSSLIPEGWIVNYILPKNGRRRVTISITISGDISNGTVSIYCEESNAKDSKYIVVLVVPKNIEMKRLDSILKSLFTNYSVKTFATPETPAVKIDIGKARSISEYSDDGLYLKYGVFLESVFFCECYCPKIRQDACFKCKQSNSASGGGAGPKESINSASGGGA
jgi:hypothetical protein